MPPRLQLALRHEGRRENPGACCSYPGSPAGALRSAGKSRGRSPSLRAKRSDRALVHREIHKLKRWDGVGRRQANPLALCKQGVDSIRKSAKLSQGSVWITHGSTVFRHNPDAGYLPPPTMAVWRQRHGNSGGFRRETSCPFLGRFACSDFYKRFQGNFGQAAISGQSGQLAAAAGWDAPSPPS